MPRVLSDEQMKELEAQGQAKPVALPQFKPDPQKRVLSDSEMSALEKSGHAKEVEPSSIPQTFAESAGNSALLGYLPHAEAVVQGFMPSDKPTTYVERRDANIKRIEKQAKENPRAALAGTVTGLGATLLIPSGAAARLGATAAKGATTAAKIAQGTKTGAFLGAIANPGDTEGQVGPQFGERTENAALGAALGGASSAAIEIVKPIQEILKKGANKLSSALTGVSERDIQTYAKQTQEVDRLFKESGGQISEAADQIRGEVQSKIRSAKQTLNQAISDTLKTAPKESSVDIQPILDKLNEAKGKLNPNLKAEAYSQIGEMATRIQNEGKDGKVSLQQLNDIKEFLQDRAKSAYFKDGQIFSPAKESAQVAKVAGAVTRKILNPLAPEIAQANNRLALLHGIEDKLNRNLIAPGKPEASLIAAGAGMNQRNERVLNQLSEFTGYPLLDKARQLSAAKTFGSPSLLPIDTTGKAVARQIGGAALGAGISSATGEDSRVGGLIGAALTSPAALKAAIKTSNLFKNTPSMTAFAQGNPLLFQVAVNALGMNRKNVSSDETRRADILNNPQMIDLFKSNPVLIENIKDAELKEKLKRAISD